MPILETKKIERILKTLPKLTQTEDETFLTEDDNCSPKPDLPSTPVQKIEDEE